jgi:LysR family nitrogen assimilation transcriptional regulator
MDFRQLRTFVHIAELHSFTRASASLHVSQPALSRQMRLLEEELGIKLLHRYGHGVKITEDGRMFLDRCRQLISEFEGLKRDFQAHGRDATTTGSVSVGLPVPATRFLGSTFIGDFNTHYSGIALRIVEGFSAMLHEWLLSGSLDLAIIYGPTRSKILTSEPVLVEDLYAITAATPENRLRTSISATELASGPLILPNRPHILRDLVDQLPFKCPSFIEVGAITMMIELARAGKGYSILPHSAVDAAIAAGDIVALPIHGPNLSWEVSICYSNLRPLSAPAEVMRRLIRKELIRMVIEGHWTARLIDAHGR